MIYVSMLDYHLACLKKSSPSAARSSSGAELILRSATLEAQFCPHGHGMPWLRVYHAIPCYTTFSEKQICLEHLGASWFMPLLVLMPKKGGFSPGTARHSEKPIQGFQGCCALPRHMFHLIETWSAEVDTDRRLEAVSLLNLARSKCYTISCNDSPYASNMLR